MRLWDKLYRAGGFLGRGVLVCSAMQLTLGSLSFVVEFIFAYGFQVLLVTLGLASGMSKDLPNVLTGITPKACLALIIALALARAIVSLAVGYVSNLSGQTFRMRIRNRILRVTFSSSSITTSHLMNLFGFRTERAGDCLYYVNQVLFYAIVLVLLLVSIMRLSPGLALAGVAALATLVYPIRALNKKVVHGAQAVSHEWDAMVRRLNMAARNLLLLRIYDLQAEEERLVNENMESAAAIGIRFGMFSGVAWNLPQAAGIILACSLAFLAKGHSSMASSDTVTFLYLFFRLAQALSGASQSISNIHNQWPMFVDVYHWWEKSGEELRQLEAAATTKSSAPEITVPIGWSLSDVSFAYPNGPKLFSQLSLDISPGTIQVIQGMSGVGKSTLLQILLGQLEPTDGNISVTVGDRRFDLKEVKSTVLKHIGYVGAEPFMIDGTIYENITFGLRQPPEPAFLSEMIRMTECHFIDELANGLKHVISEQGQGLSDGQKQRLSLLRAMLRRPIALILDEATSNLDVETEAKLLKTFESLRGKATIILVSHRPSVITLGDRHLKLTRSESLTTEFRQAS